MEIMCIVAIPDDKKYCQGEKFSFTCRFLAESGICLLHEDILNSEKMKSGAILYCKSETCLNAMKNGRR